jgi:endonuclease YncB( thermonuclease family)
MRNARTPYIALLTLLLSLVCARPAAAACDLAEGRTGVVGRVIDGETLVLEDGGEVKLLGVLAPAAPAWWKQAGPWPPAEAAKRELARLIGGKKIELKFDARRQDRRKRWLAQLYVADGGERIWVQSQLVGKGLARAHAFFDNRACQRELQQREATARKERLGLWRQRAYRVMDAARPERLKPRVQTFQIVEGEVAALGRTSGWTFLNFGSDRKTDFTVAIAAKHAKAFAESDVALDGLEGRRVRVRGWIERWNGPAIKVTHPEQIEVLDDDIPTAGTQEKTPAREAPGL